MENKARSATVSGRAKGSGLMDAMFRAIKKAYPHDASLQVYQVNAVTKGTDAQAEVSVRLESRNKTAIGQSVDIDTLTATGRAYVNAINRLYGEQAKTAGAEKKSALSGI